MITYHKEKKVLELDLIDLEHCGFDVGELIVELLTLGIEDPGAGWPTAMIVNFAGGCIMESTDYESVREARRQARADFAVLRARLLSGTAPDPS